MRENSLSSGFLIFTIYIAPIILGGCSGDEDGGVIGTGDKPVVVKGTAQKGPFVKSAEVIINPLDVLGQRTNKTINTKTIDNLGNFDFIASSESLYDITIHGIHFNELSGSLSTQPISLHAIYLKKPTAENSVYINVLTHLIHQRIIYLIQNGNNPADALAIAQDELLFFIQDSIFIVDIDNIDFTNISVYNLENTDELGNALLLYVTTTLYQTATTRTANNNSDVDLELGLLLDEIASDLSSDGKIVDLSLIRELRIASYLLDPEIIESNLISYSVDVLGQALSVPDMNSVLDTDRDGIVNNIDTDDDGDGMPDVEDNNPYRFEIITEQNVAVSVSAGGQIDIPVNFNKPALRPYMFTIISQPKLGSITAYFVDSTVPKGQRYSAFNGSQGIDEFTYKVVSNSVLFGDYASELTTITINVTAAP